ncbi:hypothetical protein [Phaeovulum sp. W22_SRMD_FR3]|uniref:hypothetical protein n=1 Tax=Phaeovulum sp. W22_SRMD_FR3 TaxID=3240274 RepID=UPI003F9DEA97
MQSEDYNRPANAPHVVERRGNGGIFFVLGAIVVALGVVVWLVSGDSPSGVNGAAPETPQSSITINNDAAPAPAETPVETPSEVPAPAPTEVPAPAPDAAPQAPTAGN